MASDERDLNPKHLPEHVDVGARIFRDGKGVIFIESPLFTDYVGVSFRLVKTRRVEGADLDYEDVPGSEPEVLEFYCPRPVAEAMTADVALGGMAPWMVVIELAQIDLLKIDEADVEGRHEMTMRIREMNRFPRRAVRAKILYDQASLTQQTVSPEEARARDAATPDFETYVERELREQTEAALKEAKLGKTGAPIFQLTLVGSDGFKRNLRVKM